MISSIFHVIRRRGIFALISAIIGGVSAAIGRVIGRQFAQRIYDYRMWLDLNDPGISRGFCYSAIANLSIARCFLELFVQV